MSMTGDPVRARVRYAPSSRFADSAQTVAAQPAPARGQTGLRLAGPHDRNSVSARFRCGECGAVTRVEPDADAFWCASCGSDNSLRECAYCRVWSVVASPYGLPASGWACGECEQINAVSADGSLPIRWRHGAAVLNQWPVSPSGGPTPLVALGGFTIVAGEHWNVPLGAPGALAVHEDGIEVVVCGKRFALAFAFAQITRITLSGRRSRRPLTIERGAGGALASPIPPAAATESIVHISGHGQSIELTSDEHSLARVRSAFAGALTRWDAVRAVTAGDAQHDAELNELRQLTQLCDAEEISRAEFHVVRALVLKRITGRDR